MVQIPLTLGIGYLLVKQFADAYEKEKKILNQYSKELEYLATKDTLTGLYNRRSFDNELKYIIEKETVSEAYLALFDIDHFKIINDNYGHVFGDQVLRNIADLAKKTIPVGDFISRWGGDEFAVLFKGSEEELKQYIHELRKEIANMNDDRTITISVGITEIHKGENIDEILKRADQALYTSKENGRNQIRYLRSKVE